MAFDQQRLTVCANKAPVAAIMREVARKTGVRVIGLRRPLGTTSRQFTAASLDSGLKMLLEGMDYIVIGDLSLQQGTPLIWIRGKSQLNAGRQQPGDRDAQPFSVAEDLESGEGYDPGMAAMNGGALPEAEVEESPLENDPGQKFVKLEASIQQGDEQALAAAVLDSDPALQTNAHEALKAVDPEAAKDALLAALNSDVASTRLQALQLLQQSSQDDARAYLAALEKSLGDSDEQVRIAAVQGLVRMGGPEEMSYVRQALHDSDPAIRLVVITSAGSQDRSLLSTALNDPDEAVRGAAAELLQEPQNTAK